MTRPIDVALRRAQATWALRQFFRDQGFLEVDTPVCVTAPAPELQIDAVPLHIRAGDAPLRRFLQTSPELAMKRLLAQGLDKIYQLAAVFRDGESGPLHTPEFRLLEWYRRGADWRALFDDCEALMGALADALGVGPSLPFRGRHIDIRPPFMRMTVDEAFRRHAGFSILGSLDSQALASQLDRLGLHRAPDDDWSDLFHRVFLTRVEPALAVIGRPLFLTHYPAPLCALAKLDDDDPRAAQRFELYAAGVELANGFTELTDAGEQRRRFEAETSLRRQAGKHVYPTDECFLSALSELASAAGIAVGMERLFMLLLNAETVDDVAFIRWSDS